MATDNSWKIVVWERSNKVGKWCAYSSDISQLLEINFRKNLSNICLGDADPNLKMYSVNLKDMVQVSEVTGTRLTVRRKLCDDLTAVGRGFIWQWHGDGHDVWHSYDIDVNNFLETAFIEGKKSVSLNKTFPGYNFEVDFTKMLQTNKRTRRKRSVRRQQNISPYPVVKCEEAPVSDKRIGDIDSVPANGVQEILLPDHLSLEIPGTDALMTQVNQYYTNVKRSPTCERFDDTYAVSEENNKGKKSKHTEDSSSANCSKKTEDKSGLTQSSAPKVSSTAAFVNGKPWTDSWPPYTPQSKLKPVPGVDPLPKFKKPKARSKHAAGENINAVSIVEKYSEAVVVPPNEEQACIICCELLSNASSYEDDNTVVKLVLCSHMFHKACLEAMYNSGPKERFLQCPTCKKIHGEKCGSQPPGDMIYHVMPYSLPGYPENDTIRIIYDIPSGIQGPEHPRPGKRYTVRGFPRHCYLPDNEIGRKVLRLLVKAWQRRLIFTVGTSSTTGEENTVTWNEIHHKTEFGCNRRGHGYPDPNYFQNILAELEAHGVTDDEVYLWYPA